jgi:hypothetical protein
MSLILSFHRYDGWAWFAGEYILFSLTLGWVTITATGMTIEKILETIKSR